MPHPPSWWQPSLQPSEAAAPPDEAAKTETSDETGNLHVLWNLQGTAITVFHFPLLDQMVKDLMLQGLTEEQARDVAKEQKLKRERDQ